MALTQMLYSLERGRALPEGSLNSEKELEDLLSDNIDLLDPNWLVIGRQVTTPNGKALDLLCMDRGYKLIVLELKRELTPREVTAQVIEYASYVAEMEKDALARCYQAYAQGRPGAPSSLNEAFQAKFGVELDESQIDGVPRMVIVAAKMDDGTEHIIRYLRKTYDVDINILFFRVFQGETERFLSRVWFEENAEIDARREYSANWNREYYISFGECAYRKWEDARKYGFVSGGGGKWYSQTLRMLHSGDRVWVNIPHTGYVGVGIVRYATGWRGGLERGRRIQGDEGYGPLRRLLLLRRRPGKRGIRRPHKVASGRANFAGGQGDGVFRESKYGLPPHRGKVGVHGRPPEAALGDRGSSDILTRAAVPMSAAGQFFPLIVR